METNRRKLVYELFIEQFIAMARVAIKYRSLEHAMGLLKQARRICTLFIDDRYESEAESYDDLIETLSASAMKLSACDGPELPRRLSESEREILKNRQFRPISAEPDIESDDDNDEIYNYHQSVVAQINITSSEHLARFQHTDENDDEDVSDLAENLDRIELSVDISTNDSVTQL